MRQIWLAGLTGGIGSGKSAAARMFAELGVHTVDADEAARWVVEPGQPALVQLVTRFGEQIVQADGQLNRAALRERIFSEPEQRQWVEQLLHPLIRQAIDANLQLANSVYALLVSPLLIESGQYQRVQRVIVVDVPPALQIERVVGRDQVSQAQVEAIMRAQLSREERLQHADDVLRNHGSVQALEQQVLKLHHQYLQRIRGEQ